MQRISKLTGTAAFVGLGLSLSAVAPAQAAPAVGPCKDVSIEVESEPGSPGMGHYSQWILVTNKGSDACNLNGHPGVQRSVLTSSGFEQYGAPAAWTNEGVVPVQLKPGETGRAILRVTQPHLYDAADCGGVVDTDALTIYLPGGTSQYNVAAHGDACSSESLVTSTVGVFK